MNQDNPLREALRSLRQSPLLACRRHLAHSVEPDCDHFLGAAIRDKVVRDGLNHGDHVIWRHLVSRVGLGYYSAPRGCAHDTRATPPNLAGTHQFMRRLDQISKDLRDGLLVIAEIPDRKHGWHER